MTETSIKMVEQIIEYLFALQKQIRKDIDNE